MDFLWGRVVFEYCEVLFWCLDDREDPIVTVFGYALEVTLYIDGIYKGKWNDPNGSSPFDLYNIGLWQWFVFYHHFLDGLSD